MAKKGQVKTGKTASTVEAPTAREVAADVIRKAAEKWPTSFIPRSEVPSFTGNLIAVGTLANLDSLGQGPKGSFRIGRQRCYPITDLCNWLIDRIEV